MTLNLIAQSKSFGGEVQRYQHDSASLNCSMNFGVYLPPQALVENQKVPVLFWLSGLTCTDENFMQKAGAQRLASELGIMIITPDTSPRGDDVPDDANGAYDFGIGAGFYVNATQMPFQKHYHMYDYITKELPAIIHEHLPSNGRFSISGHSMGGHGALIIGFRNPGIFKSISAFSPICSPTACQWGQKALSNYLGDDQSQWLNYDATKLMENSNINKPILIDQGTQDQFLTKQLMPNQMIKLAKDKKLDLTFRLQDGYDHSYYFIASFIDDHLRFHAKYLTVSVTPSAEGYTNPKIGR